MDDIRKVDAGLPGYLLRIHPAGRIIYLMIILIISSMLCSLPLIRVNVCVTGTGIIRPALEKTIIYAALTGVVSEVEISEGEHVSENQALLNIRSYENRETRELLLAEMDEVRLYMDDLEGLIKNPLQKPASGKYLRVFREYSDKIVYLELASRKAAGELLRYTGLFEGGLISRQEYEDLVYKSERCGTELKAFVSGSVSGWESDLEMYRKRFRELKTRTGRMEDEISLRTIHSPLAGNIVEFSGIVEGSIVKAGSEICIISPDTGLVAEFYTGSLNMAYLKVGQKVQLHIDAFNALEWGTIPARISNISNDYILLNGSPGYRIKCVPERSELRLKNGFRAEIRKGMTFNARCIVSRRSLLQLITDNTADWLLPSRDHGSLNTP